MQSKIYKSPLKKLTVFFEKSRDNWKAKYVEKKIELKRAKNQINDLKHRKESWKDRAIKAEEELKNKTIEIVKPKKKIKKPPTAKNYSYTVNTIQRYIELVLLYSISMNAASKILPLMFKFNQIPSINSGKSWILKLGYYNLTKELIKADDWIYIIDHSIQMGKDKLLLILGVRAEDLPKNRALKYEDMEIIDLQPVSNSTGAIVYEQIKEASKRTNEPRAIVSDMGSDIRLGVKKFQEDFASTSHIYDLKHKIALLIKKILEENKQWSEYKKDANLIVKTLQNTTLAGYRPPKQKEKARYMNIEGLVRWGKKILLKYDQLKNNQNKTADEAKLEGVLESISKFKDDLEAWNEMVIVFELIENFMNIYNLKYNSYQKFNKLHGDELLKIKTDKAKKLANQILDFIKEQEKVCNKNERLLHSSQIIESLFGKLKFIEKEQSRSSFTSLILSVGAMVSKKTTSVIGKALEAVNVDMIYKWSKKVIGTTVQSQRNELYQLVQSEQK
jgi:hypothetical protein